MPADRTAELISPWPFRPGPTWPLSAQLLQRLLQRLASWEHRTLPRAARGKELDARDAARKRPAHRTGPDRSPVLSPLRAPREGHSTAGHRGVRTWGYQDTDSELQPTTCRARPQQASLSASEDGDAEARRARPAGRHEGCARGAARGRGLRATSLPGGVWASSGPNLSGAPFPVEPCRCVSADVSSRQGWERTLSHTIRSATSLFPRSPQISSRSF